MKLHLNKADEVLLIRGYLEDQITIGNDTYRSSLIISPRELIDDWHPRTLTDLSQEDFELMLRMNPEVVLLGTGGRIIFPSGSITLPLIQRSVGLEVMDTAAACRTYNILANEGRNVVACLIIEASESSAQIV